MKIYFVVLLLMIRVAELHETSPEEENDGRCGKFSISAEDLRDSSKLSEIREFLYKALKKNGGSGLEITTTISTNDDDISYPTSRPPINTTSAKVPDGAESHSPDNSTSSTTRYNSSASSVISTISHLQTTKSNGQCNSTTRGLDIWTVVHDKGDINFTKAQEICSNNNSDIAIIPDETAYNKVVEYVRTKIPSGIGWIGIWTGLKIDSKDMKTEQPCNAFIKWATDDSFPVSGSTHVFIRVCRPPPNNKKGCEPPDKNTEGMRNESNTQKRKHGVVCQGRT